MISAPGSRKTPSTRSPSAICAASSAGVNCGRRRRRAAGSRCGRSRRGDRRGSRRRDRRCGGRGARSQSKSRAGDDVPPVDRQAPVLPGLAERVGRHADRRVQPELVLPRPDVGAVAADHERQVAEQRHAGRPSPRAARHWSPATHCRYCAVTGCRRPARPRAAASAAGMRDRAAAAGQSVQGRSP